MNVQEWLESNSLQYQWVAQDKVFSIGDEKFTVVLPKKEIILDENFEIILDEEDWNNHQQHGCKYLCFEFGDRWYYSSPDKTKLNILKYIGRSSKTVSFPYLGIHGSYEVCNGSSNYKRWCQKGKFLQVSTLGVCEKNTLGGTLQFQLDCLANNIKPILGFTAFVKNKTGHTYFVKLYAKNADGWRNLLWINKAINVDNEGFVLEEEVIGRSEGIACVIGKDCPTDDPFVDKYMEAFGGDLYHQIDPVRFKSDNRDMEHLVRIKEIYEKWHLHRNRYPLPILICDSYYVDREDSNVKDILNKIGKLTPEPQSDDQYFKNEEEIIEEIMRWFPDQNKGLEFLAQCIDSVKELEAKCDFKINTKEFHLPQYSLSKIEDLLFANKYDLFWDLMDRGLEKNVIAKGLDPEPYYSKLQTEFEIIERGGFIDYFLMLADIIKYCEEEKILVGAGRGSAAGSVISYFLNITKVDPLEHGLIFERFLNEGRILTSLPDIDLDFDDTKRPQVVSYIKERYGADNVCLIGSYGQFKIKSAIKDLGRIKGIPPQTMNFFAAMMDESGIDFEYVFQTALANEKFKEFVQENYDVINDIPLLLGSFRGTSIHASGVIVSPKIYNGEQMTIYDWMPVKKVDGELISQWDGVQLDKCGFLKADILGLKELSKFSEILSLIEKNGKEKPEIYKLVPNDDNVYELFKNGLTQDAFQFGTDGLIRYCAEAKPRSLSDLAIINAIYRPGAMLSNAHREYVRIKEGRKEIEYDFGLKEVTEETYGLYIFQETVMKACQVLGGMTMTEADSVRAGMGKKKYDQIIKYKDKFIQSAIAKGCDSSNAEMIWRKLEVFSGYGFNKAHAITYSYMGYIGQYLKYYFPVEFWTVSLENAKEDEVPKRVNEISRSESISILPPDINTSGEKFVSDFNTGSIYWSIGRIKNAGGVALNAIIEERNKKGRFFSLTEFLSRVEKRKVNKTCVTNLILAGAFDDIENVKDIRDRKKLLIKYHQAIKQDISPEYLSNESNKEWFWFLQQRKVSSFGIFDYSKLIDIIKIDNLESLFCQPERINLEDNLNKTAVIVGILTSFVQRISKKGEFGHLTIDQNNAVVDVTLWNEIWRPHRNKIMESEGKIVAIKGKIVFDKWRDKNVIHSEPDTEIFIL